MPKKFSGQIKLFGNCANLLAKLNSYTKDVSWESLEASLYSQENSVNLKYEQFKALFYQIYDEDDLGRDVKIKDLFYKKMDLTQFFHQEDFLSFVVKIWISIPNSSQHDQIFETIFKDLIAQSVNVNMKVSRWYELLKKRLSHKEVQSSEAADQGIAILPLMSAGMCSAKHRIYLGLTDDSFHRPKTKLMNLSDANTLKNQFDLAIETNEENFLDFNLRWQSVAAVSTYHYLSPHLSFSSDPLNPCLFFIENNATAEVVNPPITRLDELQLKTAYDMQMDLGSDYNLRHKQDLLGFETKIDAQYFNSLSVSSLENYAQCSFKLMAEKGFRLRDYPLVGIDLDPRQKGTLAHELFESVVKQCKDRKYDEKLIEQVLEEARAKNKIYLDSEELWSIQKKKYLVLAKKFYDFEVSRLVNIDIETEKKVEIFYNLKENKFEAQVGDDSIKLSFRIDRVDKHKTAKYFVIYDYKSSSFQVNNYSKWLSELQFQMLFYMLSFCLVEGESLESIKGALYYQYKSFNLNNGLIDKQIGKEIFGLSGRSGALIEQDEKEELMAKFEAQTKDLLNFIGQGVVSNAPADTDYCNDCEWSKICRAPHLM